MTMEIIHSDRAPATLHIAVWVSVKHDRWDPEKRDRVFCGWAGGYVPLCNARLNKTGTSTTAQWMLAGGNQKSRRMCKRCSKLASNAMWLAKDFA